MNQTQYWTTWRHHSARTTWEPTDARTLRGAKRVATQRHGGELVDATLLVGATMRVDDYGHPDIVTVARRGNGAGDRWYNDHYYA